MLKIKFNMMFNCEQIQIRTLEDLRNNFFVEDVLRKFNDGELERWLDARYYTHELKAVKELKESGITNAREILEGLIHIFVPDMKTEEIDSELSMYDYLEERKKFWEYVRANGLNEIEELRRKNKELSKGNSKLKKKISALKDGLNYIAQKNSNANQELTVIMQEVFKQTVPQDSGYNYSPQKAEVSLPPQPHIARFIFERLIGYIGNQSLRSTLNDIASKINSILSNN